jgi:hypothetical protein
VPIRTGRLRRFRATEDPELLKAVRQAGKREANWQFSRSSAPRASARIGQEGLEEMRRTLPACS